jgi:uncharacterized coiled-coil DUF342 family protein
LTEQHKTRQIAEIAQRLAPLREEINTANAEKHAYIEKRDKLNQQHKKLRLEIQELQNERNIQNDVVKTLKQQREEARAKIRVIIEDIKKHGQKIAEIKKKKPRISRPMLQKELEDIEWEIQTTPFDMQEERKLTENVKKIETQLNVYKKLYQHARKRTELKKELEMLKANANTIHQKLTETAKKSQEIHAKMIAKINESKNIKDEADSLHSACIQTKEQLKFLSEQFKRLIEHRKKLQDAVHEEDEMRKKNAMRALKEKLESQARDKLKRGEKLSWDEFKLIADS